MPENRTKRVPLAYQNLCNGAFIDEARYWYEKAKSSEPIWPAYVSLAELCELQDDRGGAEAFGRRAIEVAPDCPAGYFLLGRLYEEQHRWKETQRLYEGFPDRPHRRKLYARVAIARMHVELGEHEAARHEMFEVLRRAVQFSCVRGWLS